MKRAKTSKERNRPLTRRLRFEEFEARQMLSAGGIDTTPFVSSASVSSQTVTPSVATLDAPTNFVGTATSSTTVSLSWTRVTDATGYRLYQMVNNAPVLINSFSGAASSATVTGLTPGTTYQFSLGDFNSQATNTTAWISVSTPALVSPPTNFTAVAQSGTQVSLSWTAATGAQGYRLFQMVNGQPQLIATYGSSATSAIVNGLTAGQTYQFNLEAFNGSAFAATQWVSVTTLGGVGAPSNFTGSAISNTQVALSWSAASNATGYRLYQMVNDNPVLIAQYSASATSAVVNGLTAGTAYRFNLQAFNGTTYAATPWIDVTTTGGLAAPTNFAGTPASNTQVSLTWTGSAGATGYRLFEMVNGTPVQIANYAGGQTAAVVGSLSAGTTYQFNLQAYNGSSYAATPWISVTTLGGIAAPANFTGAGISTSQVALSWSIVSGASGYRLYQMVNGAAQQIATYNASTSAATINGLSAGTTYMFNLVAFNSVSTAATPWISATTTGGVGAPTNFAGSAISDTQIGLTWSAAAGATGYRLYQMVNGSPVLIQTLSAAATSATVSNLAPTTIYQFNLQAFNGNSFNATPWLSVATNAAVGAPSNFAGTAVSPTQINLTWTAATGAAGYRLYQMVGGQPQLLATYDASATSASLTGLSPGTTYQLNLQAFNGNSFNATPWISVTTVGGATQPGNFTGTAISDTAIRLTWDASTAATGYQLYQMVNGQPVLIQTLAANATSTTVNSLTPNTSYSFNLVAFNATSYSATAWISVVTGTTLTAPGNFTGVGVSDTQINLSWTAAAAATGYRLYQVQSNVPVLIATYSASTTSASITGLTAATSYQFNLVAYNDSATAASPWINVATLGGVSPPSNFNGVALSTTQILLRWTASANATAYQLYQMVSGSPVLIASLSASQTSTSVRNLSPGTTYQFKLTALTRDGSASTDWISVTTLS